MDEDRLFNATQSGTGLEAELGGEYDAGAAVGGERVGGTPGLVEGDHQLPPRPFAIRIGLHERFEFTDALLPAATG